MKQFYLYPYLSRLVQCFSFLKNQTTFVWVTYCYAFNVVDLQIKAWDATQQRIRAFVPAVLKKTETIAKNVRTYCTTHSYTYIYCRWFDETLGKPNHNTI